LLDDAAHKIKCRNAATHNVLSPGNIFSSNAMAHHWRAVFAGMTESMWQDALKDAGPKSPE
jgi:hypothetical protein